MRNGFVIRTLIAGLMTAAAVAGPMAAGSGPNKPADMPVHSYFGDADEALTPYTLQSDGAGGYVNGVSSVVSVLMANVFNNLYNGDWLMNAQDSPSRSVAITLGSNAAAPGDPAFTVPPNPPFWGTSFQAARVMVGCTRRGKSVLTMQAGTTMTCGMLVGWNNGIHASYRLDMGAHIIAPESTEVQVACNSADAVGCNDWDITPIPIVNTDGSMSPGRTIARLQLVAKNGTLTNLGDFYETFHFHITRP